MRTGDELIGEAMKLRYLDDDALEAFFNSLTPEEQDAMKERWLEYMAEMSETWKRIWEHLQESFQPTFEALGQLYDTLNEMALAAGYADLPAYVEAEKARLEKEESGT